MLFGLVISICFKKRNKECSFFFFFKHINTTFLINVQRDILLPTEKKRFFFFFCGCLCVSTHRTFSGCVTLIRKVILGDSKKERERNRKSLSLSFKRYQRFWPPMLHTVSTQKGGNYRNRSQCAFQTGR